LLSGSVPFKVESAIVEERPVPDEPAEKRRRQEARHQRLHDYIRTCAQSPVMCANVCHLQVRTYVRTYEYEHCRYVR
jgi:hypothetical protein